MQNRGCVLQLTCLADDRGLPVAFSLRRHDPQRGHATLAEKSPKLFTDVDQFGKILDESTRMRILDDGDSYRASSRRIHRSSHLQSDFVHLDDDFSDLGFHL